MQSGSTPQVSNQYANIAVPTTQDLSYQIQQLVEQGVITPEDAKAALADPTTALSTIQTDPSLETAQNSALDSLKQIGEDGGLTDSDKSNLNQIAVQEATQAKGARDAVTQNAAARGLGGSGLDLMAQLQADQSSASDKSARDLSVAGTAQQRALQALQDEGNLATTVQSNQFNQAATKAAAQDAISKFNATNQQATNLTNTQAANAAQAANLANKQNIANTNAGIQTQQNAQKGQVAQQIFNDNVTKAGGAQSAANFNAQAQGQNSQNSANAANQTIGLGVAAANPFLTQAAKSAVGPATTTTSSSDPSNPYEKALGDYKFAEGGLIDGEPTDYDSKPIMAKPGEVVIRKQDVPNFMVKAHTDKNGKFDAGAFLDTLTGHKFGYSKGTR